MNLDQQKKYNLIALFQFLMFIALVFGPFTALRVSRVGLTEVACLSLVILMWLQNPNFNILHPKYFTFSRFLFIWLLLSLFGLAYNVYILGFESSHMGSIRFNLTSNFIVFISCLALELLIYNQTFNITKLLAAVFYCQSLLFLGLFILSLRADDIFGFVLNHQGVFQPLSTNLHHGAMSILPLPFIGLEMMARNKSLIIRLLTLALIISNVYIGFEMESGSYLLGIVMGFGSLIVLLVIQNLSDLQTKVKVLGIAGAAGLIVVTLTRERFFPYLAELFQEEDGGGARIDIWTYVLAKIVRNPLFGYGPGAHGPESAGGGVNDAHQSILTVGVQSGILPMILYIKLLIRLLMQTFNSPYAFATLVSVYAYVFTTDINRRLPTWILFILLYYRAVQEEVQDELSL